MNYWKSLKLNYYGVISQKYRFQQRHIRVYYNIIYYLAGYIN